MYWYFEGQIVTIKSLGKHYQLYSNLRGYVGFLEMNFFDMWGGDI